VRSRVTSHDHRLNSVQLKHSIIHAIYCGLNTAPSAYYLSIAFSCSNLTLVTENSIAI